MHNSVIRMRCYRSMSGESLPIYLFIYWQIFIFFSRLLLDWFFSSRISNRLSKSLVQLFVCSTWLYKSPAVSHSSHYHVRQWKLFLPTHFPIWFYFIHFQLFNWNHHNYMINDYFLPRNWKFWLKNKQNFDKKRNISQKTKFGKKKEIFSQNFWAKLEKTK